MKLESTKSDFSYDYSGCEYSESEIVEKGFLQLTGKQLFDKINNKLIYGDYPNGYKFVTNIYPNGTVDGENNVGTSDFGHWTIDENKNTLKLVWEHCWLNTETRAYSVNGNIEFFDVATGVWRTSFKIIQELTV